MKEVKIEKLGDGAEIKIFINDVIYNSYSLTKQQVASLRDACQEFLEQEPRSYETSCMFCRHLAETSEKEPCNGCFKGDRFEAKEEVEKNGRYVTADVELKEDKPKKLKLRMGEKKLKKIQESICSDCVHVKGNSWCFTCKINLQRYVKKEV